MVNTSPAIAVTRTISALVGSGINPPGASVALNGGAGKRAPSPVATVNEVPVVGGDGATATEETAKFLCASNAIRSPDRDLELTRRKGRRRSAQDDRDRRCERVPHQEIA